MKKLLLTLAMVMAVLLVVQPTYAASGKSFNIVVTISSISMELLEFDASKPYNDWPLTVPPGGCVTMTAKHAIMVSLTGDLSQPVDIFTHVETSGAWNSVMPTPGVPLGSNEFILLADNMMNEPIDNDQPLMMAQPKAITDGTDAPLCSIPANEDRTWLIYSFHAGPDYTVHDETIEIKVEAMPVP